MPIHYHSLRKNATLPLFFYDNKKISVAEGRDGRDALYESDKTVRNVVKMHRKSLATGNATGNGTIPSISSVQ